MASHVVLDASALIAMFLGEPGAADVRANLAGARLSTVNLAEVLGKLAAPEESAGLVDDLLALDVVSVDFTPADALEVARLLPLTRSQGLSLGDRACLALGRRLGAEVLTTEQRWAELSTRELVIKVTRLFRP